LVAIEFRQINTFGGIKQLKKCEIVINRPINMMDRI
jgi:hypothetical protein